jgi:hypothetical protein
VALAAAVKPLEQEFAGEVHVARHPPDVPAHSVVLDMPPDMAAEVVHHGRAPFASQRPKALIQPLELVAKSPAVGLSADLKSAPSAAGDIMGKAQEAERPGSAQPISMALSCRLGAETQHRGLVGLDRQPEIRQSLCQLAQKTPSILLALEARHEIIGKAHQVRLALTRCGVALLEPEVQYIMNKLLNGLRSRAFKSIELSRGFPGAEDYGDCKAPAAANAG